MQKLIVIDTSEGILELQKYLEDKEFIAFDTETTGLTARHEVIGFSVCAEEDKAFYVILRHWCSTNKMLVTYSHNMNPAISLLNSLRGKSLIMHNGVFDCMMVEANFKVSLIDSLHTDTMELAHLLDENRKVALKELATVYFGEDSTVEQKEMEASVLKNCGILTKTIYELYKGDPYLIGKYGAKDTLLTLKLFYKLVPELYDKNLDKFFYEDESMPLLRGPTYDLNTTGLTIDTNKLVVLKKTLQAECLEARDFIYKEIHSHIKDKYPGTKKSNTFNIGASQQLSWLLFGQLKLEFGTLTKGGKVACKALNLRLPYTQTAKRDFISICDNRTGEIYEQEAIVNGKKRRAKKIKAPWSYIAVDKNILKKLSTKYKWIESLIDYQRKTKLLSTYIEGIEERIHYGIVTSSYLQHGTITGRYASRNPNLQNLPRNDQRVKECFVSRPGKVFVSADQSQLEPRVFAFYSKDTKLMSAFDGTSDFYSVVGCDVFDKSDCTPQKEGSKEAFGVKYKKLRDDSKEFALASAYGATPNQLAPKLGKSIEDTASIMEKYFERFPGVNKMMLEAHNLAKTQGFVSNNFGRIRRLPDAKKIEKLYGKAVHWDLPYEARKILNMACNFRIQSTGASIINRAAIRFYNDCKRIGLDCKIVSQIHDELVVETSEENASDIALLLQNAMENTTILEGITLEAIPRITKNLAK